MAYYRTCPYCGANLDPGERCDCMEKESAAAHAANMDNGSAGQTTNTTTVTHPAGEVNPPLTEQTRRALLKSPIAWDFDGYIERARFWQQALKPALPRDQYYAAMSSLWKDYLRAMRAGCAAAGKGVI